MSNAAVHVEACMKSPAYASTPTRSRRCSTARASGSIAVHCPAGLLDRVRKNAQSGADVEQPTGFARRRSAPPRRRATRAMRAALSERSGGSADDPLERRIDARGVAIGRVDVCAVVVGGDRHGMARDIVVRALELPDLAPIRLARRPPETDLARRRGVVIGEHAVRTRPPRNRTSCGPQVAQARPSSFASSARSASVVSSQATISSGSLLHVALECLFLAALDQQHEKAVDAVLHQHAAQIETGQPAVERRASRRSPNPCA